MAGSYNHIVTDHGNLVSNETFVDMIENLGDAYEMAEELYGMIWYLATVNGRTDAMAFAMVEEARKHYKSGLSAAKANKKKVKVQS